MRRVIYVLVACVVVLAVAWVLAGLPGRVTAEFGATTVEMATPVAAFGLLLLFVVLYAVLRLIGAMLRLPGVAARWDAESDRRRGDAAVGRALLALAAGDKGDARREAGRARRWLGDTPQTLLLVAEAGRLAGRDDEAEDAFRRLADRPDAAFLGYRGLIRQALTRQDWTEATALARQAETAHPGAAWLRHQRTRLAIHAGHWSEALDLADTDAVRAALAAGAAQAEPDPAQATKLARQAWKADASLAPAALVYATRLRAEGREARAQAVIRHSWALAPQPDLAAFALAPVTDGLARAQAAQRLAEANPEHAESRLLLARTSLDAGLTGEARHQAALARERRAEPAAPLAAAGGDRGGGARRYRRRPACPARRSAPGGDGGCRSGMALHGVPYRACRLVSGMHILWRPRQPALGAGPHGVLPGARDRGVGWGEENLSRCAGEVSGPTSPTPAGEVLMGRRCGGLDRLTERHRGAGGQAEIRLRIHSVPVQPHFEMHVGAVRAAGGADPADDLTDPHRSARRDAGGKILHVGVAGDDAVPVLNVHDLAIGEIPPGIDHRAAGGRPDRRAIGRHQIDPRVIAR